MARRHPGRGPAPLSLAVTLVVLAACGGGGSDLTVEPPSDATFCTVFNDQYRIAVADPVPDADDARTERLATIAAWAEVLRDLAPREISGLAEDNLSMHQARRDRLSASDFISGSNEMHAWGFVNC